MDRERQICRRTFLRTTAGVALVAFGGGKSAAAGGNTEDEGENSWFHMIPVVRSFRNLPPRGAGSVVNTYDRPYSLDSGFDSRWTMSPDEKIMPGTRFETGVYINGETGPTAVIVAGQHGDEISAQYAALLLTCVVPQIGTLVIIPLANAPAIRQGVRATEYGNLNRDWPSGRKPTSELARAIWDVITAHEPSVAFDLHSSKGLYAEYDGFCQGVGQAIFPTRQGEPTADQVIDVLNRNYIESLGYSNKYEFLKGNLQVGISPLLSHKYGADLNVPAWLIETTECKTTLSDQITWHLIAVTSCLRRHGFEFQQRTVDGGH